MSETTYDTQAPIFRFLKKHKWRILLALLFTILYVAPIYNLRTRQSSYVNSYMIITSQNMSEAQLKTAVDKIKNGIMNEENMISLIEKYDLWSKQRNKGVAVKELLYHNPLFDNEDDYLSVTVKKDSPSEGVAVFISLSFYDENKEKLESLLEELVSRFEVNGGFQVVKYLDPPKTYTIEPNIEFYTKGAFWNFVYYTLILIALWEIPFLLYSSKTQETVFQPLKSDWQNELTGAKLRNQTWKAFEINIRYSLAFIAAMLQKSPIGNLIEFVRKTAS